jgi:alanine dehydrogenase
VLVLDAKKVQALVGLPRLVEVFEAAFQAEYIVPPRQFAVVPGGASERLFVTMPAFTMQGNAAVKLVTYFPDNAAKGLPNIQAAIVVLSDTGKPMALVDGTAITYLRTGAASALASKYLSNADSSHLVVIGAGALAPTLAAAHCVVRPIRRVSLWGRRPEQAYGAAEILRSLIDSDIEVIVPASLPEAVAAADIVSCATSSATPVLAGKWLKSGTLVDLVGSFSPAKREADDDVLCASRIFVDTRNGALAEAGDILDPLARGIIRHEQIIGELSDLVTGRVVGRRCRNEIITFKSVGTAIEDLVAASFALHTALAAES